MKKIGDALTTGLTSVPVFCLLALPAAARAQTCTSPFLRTPVETPLTAPDVARRIAVGDFNGDGVTDLAVTTVSSPFTLSVLLGTGSGGFASAMRYSPLPDSYASAVGDLNGDGHVDLAVTGYTTNQVAVLLGTGTGAFGAASLYPTGASSNPYGIALADFSGDDKLDVVVASNGLNKASLLLGDGTGALGAPTHFSVGSSPIFVTVTDFNKDGKADVAVANYDPFNSDVSILLGNGSGGFTAAAPVSVSAGPRSIAAADFNGDGNPDMAVASSGMLPFALSVVIGDGAGGFGAPSILPGISTPQTVVAADLNGDRKEELVVGEDVGISVLVGNGLGGFSAPVTLPTVDAVTWLAAGDFNGGGRPDVAFPLGGVWISLNTCPAFGAFYTVPPCRVLDSRDPSGPFGGVPLYAGAERRITVFDRCGIPHTARAVSLNLTATQASAKGHIRVYPGGTPTPTTSTVNFSAGLTRANNAISALGVDGDLALYAGQAYGSSVHVVIDVNGYFE